MAEASARPQTSANATLPDSRAPGPRVLHIDMRAQQRAMLDLLPTARSVDHETTEAWLSTIEIINDAEERYEYPSPDGPDGCELGRGATGRVLLARDKHLGRDVAIKELLPELLASAGRQSAELRFVREARISGQLEHPNVVTVYDLGRRANGQLYYTMKVVRGRTLQRAIQNCRNLGDRLALLGHFSGLCQAIAYAHSNGVIHRDIKPENVMIGEFGETVVLDWGGARVAPNSHNSHLLASIPPPTERRRWIGTPLYMSPEQVAGKVSEIDERSDVWALGVVLFKMLTGSWPFEGKSFAELSQEIAQRGARSVRSLQPDVEPALAAITERALRKDPKHRYPSAREMMADIEAYRSGRKVSAHAYSPFELLKRYIGRRRAVLGALGVTLLVAAVFAVDAYRRLAVSRDQISSERDVAREAEQAALRRAADLFTRDASVALASGDMVAARVLAGKALELQERSDARSVAIASAARLGFTPALVERARCKAVATSASHGVWACAGDDGLQLRTPDGTVSAPSAAIAVQRLWLSDDGTRVLFESDGTLWSWRPRDGSAPEPLPMRIEDSEICSASSRATRVACVDARGTLRVFEPGGRTLPSVELGQAMHSVVVNDAGQVCAGGRDGRIACLLPVPPIDVADSSAPTVVELLGHRTRVTALALSDDGRLLSGSGHSLRLWAPLQAHGQSPSHRVVAKGAVGAIAIDPAGRDVAYYVSDEREVRVYEAQRAMLSGRLRLVAAPSELRFGTNGVIMAGPDGYETWSREQRSLVATTPDSAWVSLGVHEHQFIRVAATEAWEAQLPLIVQSSGSGAEGPNFAALSPEGDRLVVCSGDRSLRLWKVGVNFPIAEVETSAAVRQVRFARAGDYIGLALEDGRVEVRDSSLATHALLESGTGSDVAIAFIDAGRALLGGTSDGRLLLWRLDKASPAAVVADIGVAIVGLALSADERWLVAAAHGAPSQLLTLPDLRLHAQLDTTNQEAAALHFDASIRAFVVVASGATRSWSTSWFEESGEAIWKRTLGQQHLHFDEGRGRLERRE